MLSDDEFRERFERAVRTVGEIMGEECAAAIYVARGEKFAGARYTGEQCSSLARTVMESLDRSVYALADGVGPTEAPSASGPRSRRRRRWAR